jgi:hypothetical protein
MSTEPRRYTFPPLERRGIVLGMGLPQLSVLAGAALMAVMAIRAFPSLGGLLLAAVVVASSAGAVLWRVAGRSPSAWVPIAVRWGWRVATRDRIDGAPTRGAEPARAAEFRETPTLAGVRVMTAPASPGTDALAVVKDTRMGNYVAMIAIRGRSFTLLDPTDKQRRLATWGAVLAGLGRDGSPIHRVQWIERAVPGDRDGLRRYLDQEATVASGACRDSYRNLVAEAGPVGQHHEVLLVLAVRARRSGPWSRAAGRREGSPVDVLRRELRLLQGQLRNADLVVERVLDHDQVVRALRSAVDPPGLGTSPSTAAVAGSPWPLAVDERWAMYRTDGAWHVTYWVEEWPRIDVGPDVLVPLLLGGQGRRTASVVMAPVAPAQAIREVEAARTADLADDELRRRAGFLSTARRRRQAEGVVRRESELAEGHGDYRFSGYLTVTAADRSELDDACAEVEQAARRAHLELRRLYGQQEEAFTWTLPLARGLA